jgi:hypothetical protein
MITMMFCQTGHAQSLPGITGGSATSEGKLRHLGVEEPPTRSTLSYANEHRPRRLVHFSRLNDRMECGIVEQLRAPEDSNLQIHRERRQIGLYLKPPKRPISENSGENINLIFVRNAHGFLGNLSSVAIRALPFPHI